MNNLYFKRMEFGCKCGCGFDAVDTDLLAVLTAAREHFNAPIKIHSGCRCESYNRKVGGAKESQHTKAKAADIAVTGFSPSAVADYFEKTYPDTFGIGRYSGFTHIDVRTAKSRWKG